MAIHQVIHFPILSRKKGAEVHIHRTSKIVYVYIFLQGYVRFYTLHGSLWPVILIPHNTAVLPVSVPFLCFPWKRDQYEQWASCLQVGEPTIWSNRCTMSCVEPPWSHSSLRLSPTIRSTGLREYHTAKSLPGNCHTSCKVMHPTIHTTIPLGGYSA